MSYVTTENVKIGMKVRRGPEWCWREQDCDKNGNQCEGTIVEVGSTWTRVLWSSGYKDAYRINKPDLIISDIQLEFDF